jgi:RNA recognition motif-containing protein
MGVDDEKREDRDPEFKCFVGGLSWEMKDSDLKSAFSKYEPTDATIILDKMTQRPRGFGFIWFKDKLGMDDAIRDMHNRELEGRKISVTRAVPMSETRPGTPAAALGGGDGARTREISRYPRDYGRDYGRSYDRGYDRSYSSYDRGYDRGYSTSYDPRYSSYDRGYDRSAPYSRDPYPPRGDPYGSSGYGGGYSSYERSYDSFDDRGGGGPDRRGYSAPRSSSHDRDRDRRDRR